MAQTATVTPLPPLSGNFERYIPRFRRALRQINASKRTVTIYVGAVEHLYDWLRTHTDEDTGQPFPLNVQDINREHLRQFFISMAEDGYIDHRTGKTREYEDSTINNRYRSVQQFFRWLEPPAPDDKHGDDWGEGIIEVSPFRRMRPPSVKEKPVPIVRTDSLAKLLSTKKGATFEDRRDMAIILLFIDTGMRCGGMESMRVEALDIDEREAEIVIKGGKRRSVAFGHKTARAIDRYLDMRDKAKYSYLPDLWISRFGPFTSDGIRQMITRACVEARIEHVYPHKFRHTFAHQMKVAGKTDDELMRHLHWRSRQMAIRYGESAADERARDAYREGLSPADMLDTTKRRSR